MWWLRTIPDKPPTKDVKKVWDKAQEVMGFLPNVQRLYAFRPTRFLTWWAHYQEIMRGESGLSRVEREMIAVHVSRLNHCHY